MKGNMSFTKTQTPPPRGQSDPTHTSTCDTLATTKKPPEKDQGHSMTLAAASVISKVCETLLSVPQDNCKVCDTD
jgi:hypothetical protein